MSEELPEGMKFALQVTSAMAAQTADVNNRLISGLVTEGRLEKAKRHVIIDRVYELCTGPYTPNPVSIMNAMRVTNGEAEEWLADNYDGDWRDATSPYTGEYR